jgi:hypothetical protein
MADGGAGGELEPPEISGRMSDLLSVEVEVTKFTVSRAVDLRSGS